MKIDTTKKRLLSVFRPYQVEAIKILMKRTRPVGSGRVWEALMSHSDESLHKSRASVIFFLNDLVDDGLAKWDDATGKGGHHRLYTIIPRTENELMRLLIREIETYIKRELTPPPPPAHRTQSRSANSSDMVFTLRPVKEKPEPRSREAVG